MIEKYCAVLCKIKLMFTSVNCCELLNGSPAFIKSIFAFDYETIGDTIISGSSTRYGVGSGNLLTVVESKENGAVSVLFEMEFEVKIVVLAWDQSEECLVVGDSSGTLHLVTSGGTLLFSKKLPLSGGIVSLNAKFSFSNLKDYVPFQIMSCSSAFSLFLTRRRTTYRRCWPPSVTGLF